MPPDRVPLEVRCIRLPGEPVPYAEALHRPTEPFSVGDRWGGPWETWWFRLRGRVPTEWRGRRVVARVALADGGVGFGGEGLLWLDGTPVCGLSPAHTEYPLPPDTEDVELWVEAAANPVAVPAPPAQVRTEPLQYTFAVAELAVVDPEERSRQLETALRTELASVTGAEVRDFTPGGSERHLVFAVGNAHIDTAWLWPIRETVRKCARTFATAVHLMGEYPDYRFACSQPQQLAWVKEHYPELYQRIRDRQESSQFCPVGAMWVEADCNLPSGESLVRQLWYGTRFWREEFGVESTELWLPDVFGYPAQLPQLMRRAGITTFITQKLSWNDTNRFPFHTFWWEGIDGSRVLSHFPPADTYNGDMSAAQLAHGATNAGTDRVSLYLYGYGDGGGGPTAEMVERAGLFRDVEGLPRVRLAGPAEFFAAVHAEAAGLPVWSDELYFEKHRGTYTSQARTKVANRRLEMALAAAELWAVAHGERSYPTQLDEIWPALLTLQFHDIIPGSSIEWVYNDAAGTFADLAARTERLTAATCADLAARVDTSGPREPVVVFNAASHPRAEVAGLDSGPRWVDVPAHGWCTVDGAAAPALPAEVAPVTVTGQELRNGLLAVRWDDDGLLTAVTDLVRGRELLAPGRHGNLLQLHVDTPRDWDAWDIDKEAFASAVDLTDATSVQVVETGPLRAAVRVRREFGDSWIEQTYRLRAGSARLDVVTVVEWHERHRLLKAAFPVNVSAREARCEVQFGHVRRPTHEDDSRAAAMFEVCAHRWVDLAQPGFGVAVLNDGRYGHDVRDGVIRVSVLRAPIWPDPTADQGRHEVTYSLLPHGDGLAEVLAEAAALNMPLRALPVDPAGGPLPAQGSLLSVDDPEVVVTAVLPAPAERAPGVLVRCYEAGGTSRRAEMHTTLEVSTATPTDLLGRPCGPAEQVHAGRLPLDLGPFEIRTLLLA